MAICPACIQLRSACKRQGRKQLLRGSFEHTRRCRGSACARGAGGRGRGEGVVCRARVPARQGRKMAEIFFGVCRLRTVCAKRLHHAEAAGVQQRQCGTAAAVDAASCRLQRVPVRRSNAMPCRGFAQAVSSRPPLLASSFIPPVRKRSRMP